MTAAITPAPIGAAEANIVPVRPLTKIALSPLEKRAAAALVQDDAFDAVAHFAAERATAYASGEPDVRRRALARAAAVQDAMVQELSALLASAIARRDDAAVKMLDRSLTSATSRFQSLLEQLRVEFAATRRVSVLAKGTVAVVAEEQR